MRVGVYYKPAYGDGRAHRLLEALQKHHGLPITHCALVDVYLLDSPVEPTQGLSALADGVAQALDTTGDPARHLMPDWQTLVEVASLPGVTDPVATSAAFALRTALGGRMPPRVQTARMYLFRYQGQADNGLDRALAAALHNPLIERATIIRREQWDEGVRPPDVYPSNVAASATAVERFDLGALDEEGLAELSRARLLALSPDEMSAIRDAYVRPEFLSLRRSRGLDGRVTDVEIEMIAQTWSEHCKHKILNARVRYRDHQGERCVDGLFRACIRDTTRAITEKSDFLVSVFHDNSGVVRFDTRTLVCFKVETHNSPSALDPYGGAITGIVGVNRDILGTGLGADPLFNTNVLCFGPPDTPQAEMPAGLLHPRRVLAGVHRGIVDGGNQSGIPVVGGAFLFDPSFTGKPLVFCGTGGLLPSQVRGRPGEASEVRAGDLAVMAGGRVGKDGIHGATFSSEGLSESSPTSAVQIGDPITQKKMLDFLLEARDLGLYRGITDNGAGGLSSSLGEMARKSGGVRVDLDGAPLKYPGLASWEILVSESQERMSLAVPPRRWKALAALAARRDVEIARVGVFTDDGLVDVRHGGMCVALLDLDFLHEGLPRMELEAVWSAPARPDVAPASLDCGSTLLALLRDPNIASKERLVRQYDAEVKGNSIVKPHVGAREDGPSDGAVLKPRRDSMRGLTVTHGICPRYGDVDTYHMAMCAVDEAVRAHVACGGDPDQMAALDNFCWPDPVSSPYKMAQLVRAAEGLRDACLAYRLPLISGKDSMKNDSVLGGKKLSVRPTLLVSLLGIVPDIARSLTTDLKRAGDVIYLLGKTRPEHGGTSIERHLGKAFATCPTVRPEETLPLYRALRRAVASGLVASAHDLSDGGLAVALFESAHGGRLGLAVDVPGAPLSAVDILFSETAGRLLVAAHPRRAAALEQALEGQPFVRIGQATQTERLVVRVDGKLQIDLDMSLGRAAWSSLEV